MGASAPVPIAWTVLWVNGPYTALLASHGCCEGGTRIFRMSNPKMLLGILYLATHKLGSASLHCGDVALRAE